jgi:translation initiation factor 2-alpha kinase 4
MYITKTQQILSGLDHVHQEGVMHRDLKPSNLFMARNSKNANDCPGCRYLIKIGDFGLAKVLHKDAVVNTSKLNDAIGTVTYAAPEQLSGRTYCVKSDIYSLGIILYEMYNKFTTGMERATSLANLRSSIDLTCSFFCV